MNQNEVPLVSVLIPAFNEEKTISSIIKLVSTELLVPHQIVVINDGSTDSTRKILDKLPTTITVKHHTQNQGKTAAICTGLALCTAKYVVIQDADLEYRPADINRLLQPLIEGRADVVYGSRFRGASAHRIMYYWHYLANQWLTILSNMFTNLNLTDMETGYKIFTKEIIKDIELVEPGFGMEPELTAKLAAKEARFYEMGIEYHGRTYLEGKKIGWRDGVQAIYIILKYGWLLRIKPWLIL